MQPDNELKLNRRDFSFPRQGTPAGNDKRTVRNGIPEEVIKSSYEMPVHIHRALRVLGANLGRKLNDLFDEAIQDLLSKYSDSK